MLLVTTADGTTHGTEKPGRRTNSDTKMALRGLVPSHDFTHVPTMEEIAKQRQEAHDSVAQLTPREVLNDLKEGNARFWMGIAERPELNAMERRALIMRQACEAGMRGRFMRHARLGREACKAES